MSTWSHVSSKLGSIEPETRKIAKELFEAAKAKDHDIWFIWGMGSSSEHSTGLALDLMVRNKAAGDFVRDYIWENRKRLRLRHVIWWQRITSTVVRPGVVRKMSDRGNSTKNHYDHIHVWFFSGTYQPLSEPEAQTEATNPRSSVVKTHQKNLDVTADGKWGPKTDKRAIQMRNASWTYSGWPSNRPTAHDIETVQGVIDTKVDGVWGPNSQNALEAWIKIFQEHVGVKQDGIWGPKTDGKWILARQRHRNNY